MDQTTPTDHKLFTGTFERMGYPPAIAHGLAEKLCRGIDAPAFERMPQNESESGL
jgi:hypothetical protein